MRETDTDEHGLTRTIGRAWGKRVPVDKILWGAYCGAKALVANISSSSNNDNRNNSPNNNITQDVCVSLNLNMLWLPVEKISKIKVIQLEQAIERY